MAEHDAMRDAFAAGYAQAVAAERERIRPLLRCALEDAIRACECDAGQGDPEAPDFLAEYRDALAHAAIAALEARNG